MSQQKAILRLANAAKRVLRNKYLSVRPFYRKYHYNGGLSLYDADRRGLVDVEGHVFFNRIPKAANSTVAVKLGARVINVSPTTTNLEKDRRRCRLRVSSAAR